MRHKGSQSNGYACSDRRNSLFFSASLFLSLSNILCYPLIWISLSLSLSLFLCLWISLSLYFYFFPSLTPSFSISLSIYQSTCPSVAGSLYLAVIVKNCSLTWKKQTGRQQNTEWCVKLCTTGHFLFGARGNGVHVGSKLSYKPTYDHLG